MADHPRCSLQGVSFSCGVMSISNVTDSDTAEVAYQVASRLYHPSRGDPVAFLVWSDVADASGNLERFSSFMKENTFATSWYSPAYENPRTGNLIHVVTMGIQHDLFKKWYSEQRVAKLSKVGS